MLVIQCTHGTNFVDVASEQKEGHCQGQSRSTLKSAFQKQGNLSVTEGQPRPNLKSAINIKRIVRI